MAAEVWLIEKSYEEFHERKDSAFSDAEAVDVYKQTQLLQQKWPGCIGNPPPEIGSKHGLFYMKNDWPARTLERFIEWNCRMVQAHGHSWR